MISLLKMPVVRDQFLSRQVFASLHPSFTPMDQPTLLEYFSLAQMLGVFATKGDPP
jgi:hypothetical protein